MEALNIYAPRLVTKRQSFVPGHRACAGCGEALAVKLVCKALNRNVVIVMATGCMEIISSQFPYTSWEVPWIHTLFENAAIVATGVESGRRVRAGASSRALSTKVVAMGGDGATFDIGLGALSYRWLQ